MVEDNMTRIKLSLNKAIDVAQNQPLC